MHFNRKILSASYPAVEATRRSRQPTYLRVAFSVVPPGDQRISGTIRPIEGQVRKGSQAPITTKLGDFRIASVSRLFEYTSFCNGPDDVKPPGERRAAELMLLSVVNAWPPHHAVRGSGEPI